MADVITGNEDDDEIDGQDVDQSQQQQDQQDTSGLAPVNRGAVEAPPADGYEILEVDEEGKPLSTHGAIEDRLTEQAQGDTTLLGRQQQEQQGQPLTERAKRRAAQRRARERNTAELTAERARVRELENEVKSLRGSVSQIQPQLTQLQQQQLSERGRQIEEALAGANRGFELAESAIVEAMNGGDTAAALKGMRERDQHALARIQLASAKQQLEAYVAQQRRDGGDAAHPGGDGVRPPGDGRQPAQQDQQQEFSARAKRYADEFRQDFPWYGNKRTERDKYDSRTLESIDADVMNEGYDPGTEAYWDEVEDRARVALPHRFAAEQSAPNARQTNGNGVASQQRNATQPQPRRAPPVGTAEQVSSQKPKNQIRITPERKQSLIEEGILDTSGTKVLDTGKWNRRLKYYDDFDRANPAGR